MKAFCIYLFFLFWVSINNDATSQTIDKDLSNLDCIRKDHFENGKPLDSIKLSTFSKSKNIQLRKISSFIKLIHDVENNHFNSDKVIIDFIERNKWLNDTVSRSIEYLLIDDLFRVCVAFQRFRLFQFANLAFFKNNYTDILSWSYDNYIYLKTGNIFSFLNLQNIIKYQFSEVLDKQVSQYSKDVLNRFKLNLISIGYANYDTLIANSFNTNLIKHANLKLDTTSSFEDIIYTQELSNWGILNGFEDHNLILRNKLWQEYAPPFILNIVYHNLDWPLETRKSLKKLLFINKYTKAVQIINNLDFYAKDYLDYKNEKSKYLFSFGNYDIETLMSEERNSEIPKDVNFIDSISNSYKYVEPNWLYLNLNFVIKGQTSSMLIDYDLEARKTSQNIKNLITTSQTQLRLQEFRLIKIFDPTRCVDCTNIYYGPFTLLDYFNKKEDKALANDTSMFSVYDSIYMSLSFIKNTNYLNTIAYTNEKNILYTGILNTLKVLKEIMLSARQYDKYELLSQVDDISDKMNDTIPDLLKIVKDKYRYLNFKYSSSTNQLKLFDSLYLSQINKYINNQSVDPATLQNRFYFHEDVSRNILIDIYKRNSINDSLLLVYMSYLDAANQISKRISKDLPVYNQSEDSLQAISIYKNEFFCIDNSKMKFYTTNNDTLFYKFIINSSKFKNGELSIDSNQNIIWYFVAENYDIVPNKEDYSLNFAKTERDLFVAFSNFTKGFVKKLISVDSLSKIIDLNSSKSSQFFSTTYFNEINSKSTYLYNILLKPVEEFIFPTIRYKIILPSFLVSLPLDYLFASQQNYLPYFFDFSDITSTLYNNGILKFDEINSTAVFSEMTYNNIYCNINKAYTPIFRGGISELRFSKIEHEGISKSFKTRSFTGLNSSKYNFVQTLLDTTVKTIHLITHGVYIPKSDDQEKNKNDNTSKYLNIYGISRNPSERQLLLFSSDSLNDNSKNNLFLSYELKYLNNLSHLNCIYLSACETGLIDDESTNTSGYSGFVKEFLDRGVKSVVATRWKVQDNFAADFAIKFYENLKIYKEYSEAFYRTKLFYYSTGKNPFIWTSYVFVQ